MSGPFVPGTLRLSGDQLFYTIQGEGIMAGVPSIFMRLGECNLQCQWGDTLCDAWYTWKKDTPEYQNELKDIQLVKLEQMMWDAMVEYRCNHWVITGGEPMMQAKQLTSLLQGLFMRFQPDPRGKLFVEVETNGTLPLTPWMTAQSQAMLIQFNVSPKLRSSGNSHYRAIKEDALRAYSRINSWFKFVVNSLDDLGEIEDIVDLCHLQPMRVILMPQGVDNKTLAQNMNTCVQIAKEKGWRVTPRLQIALFGNERRT